MNEAFKSAGKIKFGEEVREATWEGWRKVFWFEIWTIDNWYVAERWMGLAEKVRGRDWLESDEWEVMGNANLDSDGFLLKKVERLGVSGLEK